MAKIYREGGLFSGPDEDLGEFSASFKPVTDGVEIRLAQDKITYQIDFTVDEFFRAINKAIVSDRRISSDIR